jgi:hypothetical protein
MELIESEYTCKKNVDKAGKSICHAMCSAVLDLVIS